MRLRLLILLATLSVALALSCDQRPADPALPTVDVQWNTVVNLHRERPVLSVWGSDLENIYVAYPPARSDEEVGLAQISRYDGTSWKPVDVPIGNEYGDPVIWGSAENDIYVAVRQLHHYDGVSWTTAPVNAQWVTGTSKNNVIAADYSGIFAFDGAEWDTLRTMDAVAIHGLSSATDGSVFYSALGDISIWNGSTWTDTTLPGDDYAGSVIAFSKDDALAKGRYPYPAYRWDGVTWKVEPGVNGFTVFAGTSASDVYACGFNGYVLHFDGLAWDPLPIGTGLNLHAASLVGSNLIVAGEQSEVLAWNGSTWRALHESSPLYPGPVFAESSSRMLVNDGSSVFLFDHGTWSEKPLPVQAGAFGGSSISDVYTGTESGIFHFDGTSWALSDSLVEYQSDFWRSPSGVIYSIGRGSVYRYDGTWQQIYDGEFDFRAIGGDGGDGIVVAGRTQVGSDQFVAHFDGTTWRELPAPASNTFGIWSGPDMDLYLAGNGGLWHWNGVKFKRLSPPQHSFVGVFPLPDKRVFANGIGEVAIYDGSLLNLVPNERRFGYSSLALDGSILLLETDENRISAWRP